MLNNTYRLNNDFIINLHGSFDADTVSRMKDDIEAYSELRSNIIFDLADVQFIDSSGIGAIVYLYKRMVVKGFTVSVSGLTQQPLALFHMLFLDKTINCYENMNMYKATATELRVAS